MLKAICSRKELTNHTYFDCVCDIITADELTSMKNIPHHISTTRFQHCINVSYYSYIICRKLRFDARSAARGGLLHDLFYYNRKDYNNKRRKGQLSHSRLHPLLAAENASELVGISDLERDIIEKHMWPVAKGMPRYKESYVITFVDKYCAVLEYIIPKVQRCSAYVRKY